MSESGKTTVQAVVVYGCEVKQIAFELDDIQSWDRCEVPQKLGIPLVFKCLEPRGRKQIDY